jgi:hypothetical protein
MTEQIVTFNARPDLREDINAIMDAGWLTFMQNDPYANEHWRKLFTQFGDFQFVMLIDDEPIAVGNSIPVQWDGNDTSLPDGGWDAMLVSGMENYDNSIAPDTLSALGITIKPTALGKGISQRMILAMRDIAAKHQLKALIAPVRPTQKGQYPLIPMEQYITWTRDDGQIFDPWLRTHVRLGARVIKVAPQSMIIQGTLHDWNRWTGMEFPGSGQYVVPGALVPITVDVEKDEGTYIEPNVWMLHSIHK